MALAISTAVSVDQAYAVLFNPNDTLPLPGSAVVDDPHLVGTIIEDAIVPFSFIGSPTGGMIKGTIQQRVVRSTVDGTLDLYWRVINDPTSAGPLAFFRVGDFVSPEYNANWKSDGLGTVPATIGKRFDVPQEDFFNFQFDGGSLAPGQESYFMFFDTTATSYVKTALMDVAVPSSQFSSDVFATFTPGVVPEPTSIALWSLGIGTVAAWRRRRADAGRGHVHLP